MGNASRVHDNARYLVDQGWEVTVVAPPPSFPHGEFEQTWQRRTTSTEDGVTVHRLWAWQPTDKDPGFITRLAYYLTFALHAVLWLLLNAGKYDIAFTTSPPIFISVPGFAFKVLTGKPWILDVRDLWIDASLELGFISEGSIERVSRLYQQIMLSTADRISVVTGELEQRLARTYRVDPEKVFLLPNGVDVKRFSPSTDEEKPSPTVIYTGNIGYAQDLECCIRAMSEVDRDDATLRIVGDGDTKSELMRLSNELGLSGQVEFVGLVDREEVPELQREAAIGVAPIKSSVALEYAVPTKAYEYMASGLPVVATGTGEIERFVNESGGGVVLDSDPPEVARAIEELLSDDSLREQYGESGREYVEEKYDRRATAKRLSDELSALL